MTTTVFIRGNTVTFVSNFFDVNGAPTNPSGANLCITYPLGPKFVTDTPIAMTNSSNDWTAIWESKKSNSGRVDYTVETTGVTPFIRDDGYFLLSAGPANPEPS